MKRFIKFSTAVIFFVFLFLYSFGQTDDTIFTEDFESGWGSWWADNGLWEVGVPIVGPTITHSGTNCVGTDLDGNYPSNSNTRLISPYIDLPSISGEDVIQLKFWQWFRLDETNYAGSGWQRDFCYIQISVAGGDWQNILSEINGWSTVWSQVCLDISEYAGSNIRIAFYMTSTYWANDNGWYIDDVEICSGPQIFNNPENFETGIGDWSADNGLWECGIPNIGPESTHSGQQCVGTDLNGSYPQHANTRLISPSITLPALSGDDKIQLKFWHWFCLDETSYAGSGWQRDYCYVQISVDGGEWQDILVDICGWSTVWSQVCLDISELSESSVRIAFYMTSTHSANDIGWYIDDFEIIVGPQLFNNPEDFESGIGDWSSDNGLWEAGIPVIGPISAHSGQICVGTDLNGSYPQHSNTRLISPEIDLPSISGEDIIQLKFWHWFRLDETNYAGSGWQRDYCFVQVSVEGGEWQNILSEINGWSTVWSHVCLDLSEFAGSNIRIAFYMTSTYSANDNGWYIDDVEICTGPQIFNNPEDFENGIGDWSADNGLWEVGEPTFGPSNAHSGTYCVGTDLNANYPAHANTRLISPEINLTPISGQIPMLFFYQWFKIENNDDKGLIQLSVNGGEWQTVSSPITGTNETWSQYGLELSNYVDSTIRIAFYFTSDHNTVYSGWYIDDIRIEGIINTNETDILTYSFSEQTSPAVIDANAHTVTIEVEYGTNVTGLVATFTLSDGATATVDGTNQISGVTANNFTNPVTYVVTAEDVVTVQNWEVTVTVALNDETDILTYSFPEQTGAAAIDPNAHTVNIEVEYGTDLTDLVATFTLSDGATATVGGDNQQSGVTENDFTNPVTYVVTAEDGITVQNWIVTVTVAPNTETDILTYSFLEQTGPAIIDPVSHTVDIEVEYGTNVTSLVATFTLSDGATATVNGVNQISGDTENDFTNPVTYVVTAEDGVTVQNWIVTVDIATGIGEYTAGNFNIYPNPFSHKTTLKFTNPNHSNYKLSVFNISGNKVFEMDNIKSDKIEFEKGNLPQGVYLVELKGEKVFKGKMVVK